MGQKKLEFDNCKKGKMWKIVILHARKFYRGLTISIEHDESYGQVQNGGEKKVLQWKASWFPQHFGNSAYHTGKLPHGSWHQCSGRWNCTHKRKSFPPPAHYLFSSKTTIATPRIKAAYTPHPRYIPIFLRQASFSIPQTLTTTNGTVKHLPPLVATPPLRLRSDIAERDRWTKCPPMRATTQSHNHRLAIATTHKPQEYKEPAKRQKIKRFLKRVILPKEHLCGLSEGHRVCGSISSNNNTQKKATTQKRSPSYALRNPQPKSPRCR